MRREGEVISTVLIAVIPAQSLLNFRVRLFSVTVRTMFSGTPPETSASISSVTFTEDPTKPDRCAMTSSAMRPASRPILVASRATVPQKRFGLAGAGEGPTDVPGSCHPLVSSFVLEREFLPAWRNRPIGTITRGDINRIVDGISARGADVHVASDPTGSLPNGRKETRLQILVELCRRIKTHHRTPSRPRSGVQTLSVKAVLGRADQLWKSLGYLGQERHLRRASAQMRAHRAI
jgi:hypothetical protein